MKRMDESSIGEIVSCRRSSRIQIARDLNRQKEASIRMKRMAKAKDVGERISLDSQSKSKIGEIGSASKSKKGSGSKSKKRSGIKRKRGSCGSSVDLTVTKVPQHDYIPDGPASSLMFFLPRHPDALEELYRGFRSLKILMFNDHYVYGTANSNDQGSRSSHDPRYLICPNGYHSWLEDSSGITWVAVQGKDSICVVTKNEDVDRERLRTFWKDRPKDDIRAAFMLTVVHEMEDPSSKLRRILCEMFEQSVRMRSFAAVSVSGGTVEFGEESGHEASEAIEFLKKKLEKDLAFTQEETVQMAISALQYLLRENFQATDILVVIWKKGRQGCICLNCEDVQKHLDVIGKKQWV